MNFDFVDDEALRAYCLRIAAEMIRLFGISEDEAFLRVAHFVEPRKNGSGHQILHRSVQYWAEGIYQKNRKAPAFMRGDIRFCRMQFDLLLGLSYTRG